MKPYFRSIPVPNRHLADINPIMAGIQQCPPGYTYGPVVRQYYIIEYILRGKGLYSAEGQTFAAHAGQAFLIRPYETHLLRADDLDPWEYVWIGFECARALPEPLASKHVIDAEAYSDLFVGMPEDARPSRYAALLFEMFARMEEETADTSEPASDLAAQAKEIIQREFSTITVQALADRFFLNRSYFGAIFKKKTGKSPKAYLDEVRLSNAFRMMTEFGYTATQAALATGYSDVMAFSKMYKRHYGVSPRQAQTRRTGKTFLLK